MAIPGGSWMMLLVALAVSSPVMADQNAAGLPSLFDALQGTDDVVEARQIESSIWALWFEAPDENSQLLMSQIGAAMQSGNLPMALLLCDQLVDSAPDFAEAWNRRATVHYLMHDDDQSVADIRKTLELEPRHFGAISGLGLIFMRQGNAEAALEAFEQVLQISPASASARRGMEQMRNELGREI